jgi:hypothetical protein
VSYRSATDGHETSRKLVDVTSAALAGAAPWRTFRWVRGQKHYSGTYWSATEAGHVIYESRLELLEHPQAELIAGVTSDRFVKPGVVLGDERS